ncbi:ATP synthase subunit b', chloroplastic [Cryptomeria japonica]|uniref:ATP synthase subunit b', chloroplastic n=1 Tax=Cryptomeria japonica TaxID=3369 RepID=UPI0025AD3C42|nr:ATP synthase subunit b', chloroplastic [Cryptomeria japonica]
MALMASPLTPTGKIPLKTTFQSGTKVPTFKNNVCCQQNRLLIEAQQKKITSSSSFNIKISPALKNGCLIALNSLLAMPALAEIEKAKLFDFNLTLPIIVAEFLLLMVALDNIWIKPLGKFMDDRDEEIRQKLLSVRDNSEEIKRLQEEADAILKAARAEVTASLNQMKKEMSAELEAKLKESRTRVEKELELALQKLDVQKEETLRSLDKQIGELSEGIVKKVMPGIF